MLQYPIGVAHDGGVDSLLYWRRWMVEVGMSPTGVSVGYVRMQCQ